MEDARPAYVASVSEARMVAFQGVGGRLEDFRWVGETPEGVQTRVTLWRWNDDPKRFDVWVDQSGLVTRLLDTTPHEICPAYAHTRFNGVKPIVGTKNGGNVQLRNDQYKIWDAENGFWLPGYSPLAETLEGVEVGDGSGYLDKDGDWVGQTEPPRLVYPDELRTRNAMTPAGEVAFGLEASFRLYKLALGVEHLYNPIKGPMNATIHGGFKYDNAFYAAGLCECLFFGDGSRGDGNSDGTAPGFTNLTSLDVVAHELHHSYTLNTSNLNYWGDAGGLNEASSDIFAKAVQLWVDAGEPAEIPDTAAKDKWTIGHNMLYLNGVWRPLRWMYKPSKDGLSFDYADEYRPGDRDDPHFTSGPLNRWFYFMSQGVQAEGRDFDLTSTRLGEGWPWPIGAHKALQILATASLSLRNDASYADLAWNAIRVAGDKFGEGSKEQYATRATFAAVGAYPRQFMEAVVTGVSDQEPAYGADVAIRGGGFHPWSVVLVGGVQTQATVWDSRTIVVRVGTSTPAGLVVVENGFGRSYAAFSMTPKDGPRIASFTVDKTVVEPGELVTLAWEVGNADSVTVDGVTYPPTGTVSLPVTETHVFTLAAGGVVRTVRVIVRTADLDGNGTVSLYDALDVLAGYGKDGVTDLDGNGTTDETDLLIVLRRIK